MLTAISQDSAPPLAYLVQFAIVRIVDTAWALRLPSAIAGIAAIPLAASLGGRIAAKRGAFCAATVFTILPTTVLASRDARMYAIATTLVLAGAVALLRYAEKPTWLRWLIFAVCGCVGVYVNYFVVFALAGEFLAAATVLRLRRRHLFAVAAAEALAVLLLLPWLYFARDQLGHGATPFWVLPVGPVSIFGTFVQFFSGPPIDAGVPAKLILQTLQGSVIAAGTLSFGLLIARRRFLESGTRVAGFAAVAGLGAIAVLVVISLWRPLLEARYVSVMWGPLVVLLGVGVSLIPQRLWVKVGLVSTVLITSILGLAMTHPDTPALLAQLPPLQASDLIDSTPSQYLLLEYYGDQEVRDQTHIINTDVPWFWGTAAFPPGAVWSNFPADVLMNGGTIVMVDDPDLPPPPAPAGYAPVTPQTCFSTICYAIYRPTRQLP